MSTHVKQCNMKTCASPKITKNINVDIYRSSLTGKLIEIDEKQDLIHYLPQNAFFKSFITNLYIKFQECVAKKDIDNIRKYIPQNNTENLFELKNHQIFVALYMSPYFFNRGLYVYHDMGSGKTRTGINVAEQYILFGKKICIFLPATLKDVWIKEIKNYHRHSHNKIMEYIDNNYIFISYNSSNILNFIDSIDNGLNDKLIMVDEAHTFISYFMKFTNKKRKIYDKLMNAEGSRFLFFSGTPMVNSVHEIAIAFNILKGYIVNSLGNTYTLFPDVNNITEFDKLYMSDKNYNLFHKRINGLVSYFTPSKLDKYDFPLEEVKEVYCPLGQFQFVEYNVYNELEKQEIVKNAIKRNNLIGELTSTYNIKTRKVCNYAYGYVNEINKINNIKPSISSTDRYDNRDVYYKISDIYEDDNLIQCIYIACLYNGVISNDNDLKTNDLIYYTINELNNLVVLFNNEVYKYGSNNSDIDINVKLKNIRDSIEITIDKYKKLIDDTLNKLRLNDTDIKIIDNYINKINNLIKLKENNLFELIEIFKELFDNITKKDLNLIYKNIYEIDNIKNEFYIIQSNNIPIYATRLNETQIKLLNSGTKKGNEIGNETENIHKCNKYLNDISKLYDEYYNITNDLDFNNMGKMFNLYNIIAIINEKYNCYHSLIINILDENNVSKKDYSQIYKYFFIKLDEYEYYIVDSNNIDISLYSEDALKLLDIKYTDNSITKSIKLSVISSVYNLNDQDNRNQVLKYMTNDFSNIIIEDPFDIINIEKYSGKFKSLFDNIVIENGKILIYSNFVHESGIEYICNILNNIGYKEINPNNSITTINPSQYYKGYYRYIGDIDKIQRNLAINFINDPNNIDGKYCKILLISSAGAEGLDLKCFKFLHILEPHWNEVRIKQVIGRVIRYKSHELLPLSERIVKIFKYYSTYPNDSIESTDIIIKNISKNKDNIKETYDNILKNASIDSFTDYGTNIKEPYISQDELLYSPNVSVSDYDIMNKISIKKTRETLVPIVLDIDEQNKKVKLLVKAYLDLEGNLKTSILKNNNTSYKIICKKIFTINLNNIQINFIPAYEYDIDTKVSKLVGIFNITEKLELIYYKINDIIKNSPIFVNINDKYNDGLTIKFYEHQCTIFVKPKLGSLDSNSDTNPFALSKINIPLITNDKNVKTSIILNNLKSNIDDEPLD